MPRRFIEDRRGSESLSTLIVGVSILLIVVISSSVATYMLRVQMAQTEFEEAKENMMVFADIVEEVSAKMDSSGYVKFNCRLGRLDFLKGFKSFTLKLRENGGEHLLAEGSISGLRYTSCLSFPTFEKYLRGVGSRIVIGEASPIVSIYSKPGLDGLPSIWLEGFGVRLVEAGTMLLEGMGYVNVYDLVVLKTTSGVTFGSESINVKAYCKSVSVDTLYVDSTSFTLELLVDGVEADVVDVTGPSSIDGNVVKGSLVYVVVVTVEVSTV